MLASVRYQERLLYLNGITTDAVEHIVSEYRVPEVRRYSCDLVILALRYAYFGEFILNGGEVNAESLYNNRKDSIERYNQIYNMLS